MKNILVILPNLRICNGVASYIMNYFRNIDHSKIKMDFVVLRDIPSPYYEIIKKNGGTVFVMPSPKNMTFYCKKIKEIYTAGKYDIIHCNVVNSSVPYLYYAKKLEIKTRILHSHATKSAEVKWKEIRNNLITPMALKNANVFFSCSKMAGDYLFKDRPYTVINNALDLDCFKIDLKKREQIRSEMNLEDKFVIGTVGRVAYQKNPFFALDVFKQVLTKNPDTVYLWIGSGPLDDKAKVYAKEIGIDSNMKFLGNREDVRDLYQAMDVFFLPSLYEGLPVVGIEAQACGLPIVLADTITKEMKITDNVQYISLDAPKEQWVKALMKFKEFDRIDTHQQVIDSGYEITAASKRLEKLYLNF